MHLLKRTTIAVASLSAFALITPFAATATAHAIIRLEGVSAVAGATSSMTLEIQHGCLPAESTLQVEAFVGKSWRALKPQNIDGWSTTVAKQANGGWHVTWKRVKDPVPFGTPTFFPISVSWPKTPGTYGMSVMQLCTNGTSYYWNEKYLPASATNNSPGLTPKPEVLVVAKPTSSAPSTSKPSSTPTTQKHMH